VQMNARSRRALPIQLLTLHEAAETLRLSPRTLQRLIRIGELPVIRIGGRTLVRPDDLDALIVRSRRGR